MTDRSIEAAFWAFHKENPEVYDLLVRLAREWRRAGHGKLGMKSLYEVARWTHRIETRGDPWKLNNDWTAFYARLIMTREPDLAGVFETRRQRKPTLLGVPSAYSATEEAA